MPSLSARMRICGGLSSPLMYSVTSPCICSACCRNKVDLPMPGSPATSIREPGTMPPPSTRLSSASWVSSRTCAPLSTSPRLTVLGCPGNSSFHFSEAFPVVVTSSAKVFHCPHEGHLPVHLALSYPQFWQKKAVLVLLIG